MDEACSYGNLEKLSCPLDLPCRRGGSPDGACRDRSCLAACPVGASTPPTWGRMVHKWLSEVSRGRLCSSTMRVFSHTCSNTEIVAALGCGEQLVGVDADSDYPPDIGADLPRRSEERRGGNEGGARRPRGEGTR